MKAKTLLLACVAMMTCYQMSADNWGTSVQLPEKDSVWTDSGHSASYTEVTGALFDITPDGVELTLDHYSLNGGDYRRKPIVLAGESSNTLLFSAQDAAHGEELWAYNSSTKTSICIDILEGPTGSGPNSFVVLNDKMYFTATTEASGTELWVTDGTVAGTKKAYAMDPYPDAESSSPVLITKYNDRLLFFAKSQYSEGDSWLYIYDPTTEEASALAAITPITDDIDCDREVIITVGEKAFMRGDDGVHGAELWVTDGTIDGTHMVLDITTGGEATAENPNPINPSTTIRWLLKGNDKQLFFRPFTPSFWVRSQYADTTLMYADSTYVCKTDNFVGGELVDCGFEGWVTDGTALGTYPLGDLTANVISNDDGTKSTGNCAWAYNSVYDGKMYARAWRPEGIIGGSELVVTDFTVEGTEMFANIGGWHSPWATPNDPGHNTIATHVYDGKLFFNAGRTEDLKNELPGLPFTGVGELFWTDGTITLEGDAVTSIGAVTDISPFNTFKDSDKKRGGDAAVSELRTINGRLYFQGNDNNYTREASHGATIYRNAELYCTYPNGSGGYDYYRVYNAAGDGQASSFTDFGGYVVFMVNETASENLTKKLYLYDDGQAVHEFQSPDPKASTWIPETDIQNEWVIKNVPNSIEEYKFEHITLGPNPVIDFLKVDLNQERVQAKIYGMKGNVVWQGQINGSKSIDLSAIDAGVYVIYLKGNDKLQGFKFIKE